MSLNHGSTFHEHGSCLRNLEYAEAHLGQDLVYCGQSRGFACTRTTSEADSYNGMFTFTQSFRMIKRRILHSTRWIHGPRRDITSLIANTFLSCSISKILWYHVKLPLFHRWIVTRWNFLLNQFCELVLIQIIIEIHILTVLIFDLLFSFSGFLKTRSTRLDPSHL